MSSIRDKALAAAYEADAPKREEAAKREAERKAREAEIKRQSDAFLVRAKRKLKRTLGVDASDWTVIESHPTYAVLEDPSTPEEYPLYQKLKLLVTSRNAPGKTLLIRYSPSKEYGKNRVNNIHGDGMDWHCGPLITDLLSLGRALQAHDEHTEAVNASMPDYLP
jgi:hypothetical protein